MQLVPLAAQARLAAALSPATHKVVLSDTHAGYLSSHIQITQSACVPPEQDVAAAKPIPSRQSRFPCQIQWSPLHPPVSGPPAQRPPARPRAMAKKAARPNLVSAARISAHPYPALTDRPLGISPLSPWSSLTHRGHGARPGSAVPKAQRAGRAILQGAGRATQTVRAGWRAVHLTRARASFAPRGQLGPHASPAFMHVNRQAGGR